MTINITTIQYTRISTVTTLPSSKSHQRTLAESTLPISASCFRSQLLWFRRRKVARKHRTNQSDGGVYASLGVWRSLQPVPRDTRRRRPAHANWRSTKISTRATWENATDRRAENVFKQVRSRWEIDTEEKEAQGQEKTNATLRGLSERFVRDFWW